VMWFAGFFSLPALAENKHLTPVYISERTSTHNTTMDYKKIAEDASSRINDLSKRIVEAKRLIILIDATALSPEGRAMLPAMRSDVRKMEDEIITQSLICRNAKKEYLPAWAW